MSNENEVRRWFADNGDLTRRLNYDLNASDTVFDAGGYEGQFAESINNLYGCKVHVFEPVDRFCSFIENRFKNNLKVIAHEYGVGASTKKQNITGSEDATQLIDSKDSEGGVFMRDIKEVMEDLDISTVALFKVNIEGGEYDLLDRLIETGLIKNIRNLQVQFHDFHPNAIERRNEIVKHLSKTHTCKYNYLFVWESWQLK